SKQPPRVAERLARRLSRRKPLFAAPMAALIRALLRRREGDSEQAEAEARSAEEGFERCDMELHTACVKLRRGQWMGGEAGEALKNEAEAWMRGQGIRSPERMAAMFA